MRVSTKPGEGLVGVIKGKINNKKLAKTYNAAYREIAQLWDTLPETTKTSLKSESSNLEKEKVADSPLNVSVITNKLGKIKERVKSLQGKNVSFKDKMEKKKLKNRLKKEKKHNAKNALREAKRKKKKELKEKIRAEKLKNGCISDNSIIEENSKITTSESDDGDKEGSIKTEVKKPMKVAKIDDLNPEAGILDKSSSELSNKKLKLLKKNQLKAAKKKEKKKLLKMKQQEEIKEKIEAMKMEKVENIPEQEIKKDPEIMFNRIDFPEELKGKKKFKKEKPKVEKDPLKALIKIEALNKKITDLKEAGQEDKASAIQNKETWKNAVLKAGGLKVKDDVKLLKKTIRKKEKKKSKSQENWQKRNVIKEKKMADSQKKRKENILKKKKDKKQKKIKKSIKKGRIVL